MGITSSRTQIILPAKLRGQIEKARLQTGESLGQYLRIAAERRLKQERARFLDLQNLAKEVVGAARNNRIKRSDVIKWQRAMRRDR